MAWLRSDTTGVDYLTNHALYVGSSVTTSLKSEYSNWAIQFIDDRLRFKVSPAGPLSFMDTTPTAVSNTSPLYLKVGLIQNISRFGRLGVVDGMDISVNSRGCNRTDGALYVHEVEVDSINRKINKFAADFIVVCDGNGPNKGAIRHNSSVPVLLDNIFVITGKDISVLEGRGFTLNGTFSWSPLEPIVAHEWQQISGPALDLSQCRQAICRTFSPLVQKGGAKAVVRLSVTTASGRVASRDMTIGIRSHKDQQSRLEIGGDGFVALNNDYRFNESTFIPNPLKKYNGGIEDAQQLEQIVLNPEGVSENRRYSSGKVTVSFPRGVPISKGIYTPKARADFYPRDGIYGMDLDWDGRGCGSGSNLYKLLVGDVDRDVDNLSKINNLALWLSVTCMELGIPEAGSTRVLVWLNHKPNNPPVAVISGDIVAPPGGAVTLSASKSYAINSNIVAYDWFNVTLANIESFYSDGAAETSLIIPKDAIKGTKIPISVEIVDGNGNTSVAIHTIIVQ